MLPVALVERFHALLAEAVAAGEPEATAMSLATTGADGQPSVRIVLLKHLDRDGFVFYTNTRSAKGRQLAENPRAALCLHWKHLALQVQVRAQGHVAPVAPEEADAYFASRPRGSQIGAWASEQSQPLASRAVLEQRIAETEDRFHAGEVPRPPHWGGYRLAPDRVEFWHGRAHRLHERILHQMHGGTWTEHRLYP